MLKLTRREKVTDITFVLPADEPEGPVSVVGDFNDWQPGVHPLAARKNGTRAVTVTLPKNRKVVFRYLAENGLWFDDETAEGHDGLNCYLRT